MYIQNWKISVSKLKKTGARSAQARSAAKTRIKEDVYLSFIHPYSNSMHENMWLPGDEYIHVRILLIQIYCTGIGADMTKG